MTRWIGEREGASMVEVIQEIRRAVDALSERLDALEAEPSATQPAPPFLVGPRPDGRAGRRDG